MPFFDLFPPEEQNRLIAEAIRVGNVLKLHCDFTTPPKDKRLILVSIDPLIGFFLINSNVNPFISRNPALLRSQIQIYSADHDFLTHDSFISCHELLTKFDYPEVDGQLREDYSRCVGQINEVLRDAIIRTVSDSITLTPSEIDLVLKNLSKLEF